jgi:hypothetical protein
MKPIPEDHPFVREFEEVVSALPDAIAHDFARSLELYETRKDDPFARRLLVRSVVSYIEGQMAAVREQLLFCYHVFTAPQAEESFPEAFAVAAELNLNFSAKDYFALAGKSLKSVKHRDSTIRDEILCVEKTIKLLFKLHGRVYQHSITPVEKADGWEMLMRVKQKRNQLTHPKCAADLEVTEEQAREALIAFVWIKGYLDRIREIETSKWESLYEGLLE